VTFKTASAYWRLAGGAAARALLAQFHHTAISETGPGEVHFVQVTLPVQGAWMGPRWLTIETAPGAGGHWLAELQGVAVWTPSRLELPGDVAAVTVTSLRTGRFSPASAPPRRWRDRRSGQCAGGRRCDPRRLRLP